MTIKTRDKRMTNKLLASGWKRTSADPDVFYWPHSLPRA
jgi:hypothetical protein